MKRIVVLSFLYCSLAFGEQKKEEQVLLVSTEQVEPTHAESQKEVIDLGELDDLFAEEHTALDTMHEVEAIEKTTPSLLSYVRVAWNLLQEKIGFGNDDDQKTA